jgi:ribosomal-protein-serine acetyltransferase
MMLEVDENLAIELIGLQHAESIFLLVNKNRLHLREWLPKVTRSETFEQFYESISLTLKRFSVPEDHAFVIIFKGEIIGRIGVYNIDNEHKLGAIGYWLSAEFQGMGIVTRACDRLLTFCFNILFLNRIEIRCATKNYRSMKIPEKLGFTKEGVIREGEYLHNDFVDVYCFSLLQKEWKKRKRIE